MSESGLAAVHAAAGAVSAADHQAAVTRARAEGHAAGRAEGEAAGRTAGLAEGATAERTRILGIDAIAVPGHADLLAKAKADPSVTPEKAAMQILAAEKTQREAAHGAIAAVETVTSVVKPAPTSAPHAPGAAATVAQTPEGWKAEYAASAQLQRDYANADDYAAFKKAEASGKVRILGRRTA